MEHKLKANLQKTYLKKNETKELRWFILDAKGKTLGRFASQVANILRGKHSPDYTPNIEGDGVIVINADKIKVTGNKEAQKVYTRYTGYIGGHREVPYREMMEKHPERIIEHAVKGMLPKTKLGRKMQRHLRIFAHENHNMDAQKPIKAEV